MRYLLPHVLEVYLPLIVLKLCAHFLYLLINLSAIEVHLLSAQLSVQLVIKLLLQPGLKHIKQVADLPFILNYDLIDPLSEFPDQRQRLLVPIDNLLVDIGGLLAFADGDFL